MSDDFYDDDEPADGAEDDFALARIAFENHKEAVRPDCPAFKTGMQYALARSQLQAIGESPSDYGDRDFELFELGKLYLTQCLTNTIRQQAADQHLRIAEMEIVIAADDTIRITTDGKPFLFLLESRN